MKDYRTIKPDPTLQNNLMAFGFMCEKGWHQLIFDTLDKIEEIVVRDELDIQVTEVKEKFGGLRIYLDGYTDEIDSFVQAAEKQSFKICEICGEPGKLREINGWLMTRCDKCLAKESEE